MSISPLYRNDPVLSKKHEKHIAQRIFMRRSLFLGSLIFILLGVLILRLFVLQVVDHDKFITLSESNRIKLLPIPPTRGLIFDRNGILLANNIPSFNLTVTRQDLSQPLSSLFTEIQKIIELNSNDIARFERIARVTPPQNPVILKDRLTEAEIARLSVELYRLDGVDIQAQLSRVYPFQQHAVHALGYVGRIDEKDLTRIKENNLSTQYIGITHIGKRGAEASFEDLLRGEMGFKEVETNVRGKILRTLSVQEPIAGKHIYLSLDLRLQQFAEKNLEGFRGAIVAIDPNNGDILAFVSQPQYNPNLFVNGIDSQTFNALNLSIDKPFLNRVMQGLYPPGSTIKPQIGLAGLELGFISPEKSLNCPGFFQLPGSSHKFRDWKRSGHGYVNLHQAIEESCDIFFYDLAYTMGIEKLTSYTSQFSLGQRTGIDLMGEYAGTLPTPEYKKRVLKQPWYAGDTVTAGIGQSYWLTTPLQLAQSTALIAARGKGFTPKILKAYQTPGENKQFMPPTPAPIIELKHPRYWQYIIDSMVAVVHGSKGTARKVGLNLPFKMAGKSGTAQVKSIAQDKTYDASLLQQRFHDHALFTAFAPADDPKIVVAVIVENGGSGSGVAAPIARAIIEAWLSDFKVLNTVDVSSVRIRGE